MNNVGPSLYERIGGEEKLTELVRTFYHIMSTDPMAKECFATHAGKDIAHSGEKLIMFLSGITGGPPLYHEKIGHPRLRMRHFPFQIGEKEATQWLYCMIKAMDEVKIDRDVQEEIIPYFRQVTTHLRNK
ncbi:MAG: group II truncated hemoglobin [Bacteriovoracaceae bacterium]